MTPRISFTYVLQRAVRNRMSLARFSSQRTTSDVQPSLGLCKFDSWLRTVGCVEFSEMDGLLNIRDPQSPANRN